MYNHSNYIYTIPSKALALTLVSLFIVTSMKAETPARNSILHYVESSELLYTHHYQRPKRPSLSSAAIQGMSQSLNDPYTYYLTPHEYKRYQAMQKGHLLGIGISLGHKEGSFYILSVWPESVANKAGLKPFDRIEKINGQAANLLSPGVAETLLYGPKNSFLHLEIRRSVSSKSLQYTLKRKPYFSSPITDKSIFYDTIGYIKLSHFSDTNTAFLFQKELKGLLQSAIRALILDLRNNGGGRLDEAIKIAEFFMPNTLITRIKYPNKQSIPKKSGSNAIAPTLPLVVLIDKSSASAAEILSASLQDHQRAIVIGAPSFGKSAIQRIYPLQNGGALWIKTAVFLTPKGVDINRRGVIPDYIVTPIDDRGPGTYSPYHEDQQLIYAIDYARSLTE